MAHVCYSKLTKKKQREIDQAKRNTWGHISPVTKKMASAKVYNRKKAQRQQRKMQGLGFWIGGPHRARPAPNEGYPFSTKISVSALLFRGIVAACCCAAVDSLPLMGGARGGAGISIPARWKPIVLSKVKHFETIFRKELTRLGEMSIMGS